MASWVYLFSKFTPEALLFEALAICILICAYSAFWILRKHRLGLGSEVIPAPVVKEVLNQWIGDAEALRSQLFGILGSGAQGAGLGIDPSLLASLAARSATSSPDGGAAQSGDPDLQKKIHALEAKMNEQAQLLDKIQAEKAKMEMELIQAKAAGGGASSSDSSQLKDKIDSLEARLAEYSVIEDDLANLKRLQQENEKLKASLAAGGGRSLEAVSPSPAQAAAKSPKAEDARPQKTENGSHAPEPSPAMPDPPLLEPSHPTLTAADSSAAGPVATTEAPLITPLEEAAPLPGGASSAVKEPVPGSLEEDMKAELAKAPSEEAVAQIAAEPDFESLAKETEISLKENSRATLGNPKTETPKAPAAQTEKSDEDLIAEFEKMLNS